ncbi:MAG: phage integrase SAM-like domain-containing protein [Bacteroidota bacterium]|nr:phage integrase SAM-like domain-containing protein [Bacteroidota bacterium]
MRARFHIEKRKDAAGNLLSAERPVFMSVTFEGHRIMVGTGIKVNMNGWDNSLQRIQATYPGSQSLNNWLETMQEIADKTMEALTHSDSEVNPENFRNLFQQLKPKYSSGFFDLFFQFMESNGSSWSNTTYSKVRALYNLLREFEDKSETTISFHTLDAQFLERFVSYCREKGYQYSTTYKTVNNLVWFLNWATDKGYNVYREYRQFYKLMETPKEKSQFTLSLHWDELLRLKGYTTDNRRMERVKDLFCFMCFTGIRFSELQRLKKEDLKESQVHVKRPRGGVRIIPMNKYAMQVHQKYQNKYYLNNTAFPSLSLITMNKYLRIIGRDLGFNRMIYSSKLGEDGLPLYKLLTTGTAVNTFIRNAVELEVPVEIISRFTGVQNDSRVRRIKSDLAVEEMKKFDHS